MKIRNGFVSNSSSSSFCVVGAISDIDLDEVDDAPEKLTKFQEDDNGDPIIGYEIFEMELDETLREFYGRVLSDLNKIDTNITFDDLDLYVGTYYN